MRLHDDGGRRHPQGVRMAGFACHARGKRFPLSMEHGAEAGDITGIGRNFGLIQNDMQRWGHKKKVPGTFPVS